MQSSLTLAFSSFRIEIVSSSWQTFRLLASSSSRFFLSTWVLSACRLECWLASTLPIFRLGSCGWFEFAFHPWPFTALNYIKGKNKKRSIVHWTAQKWFLRETKREDCGWRCNCIRMPLNLCFVRVSIFEFHDQPDTVWGSSMYFLEVEASKICAYCSLQIGLIVILKMRAPSSSSDNLTTQNQNQLKCFILRISLLYCDSRFIPGWIDYLPKVIR